MNYLESFLAANPIAAPEVLVMLPLVPLQRAFVAHYKEISRQQPETKTVGGIFSALQFPKGPLIICPFVGGPAAVLAAESFLISGCRSVFFLGTCASLTAEILPGSFFVPTISVAEDFTSLAYGRGTHAQVPINSHPFTTLLDTLEPKTAHGMLCSTDVPNLESPEKSTEWKKAGIVAVEMEFAALQTVCMRYHSSIAGCFVVTDLLDTRWERKFASREVKFSIGKLCQHAAQFIFSSLK